MNNRSWPFAAPSPKNLAKIGVLDPRGDVNVGGFQLLRIGGRRDRVVCRRFDASSAVFGPRFGRLGIILRTVLACLATLYSRRVVTDDVEHRHRHPAHGGKMTGGALGQMTARRGVDAQKDALELLQKTALVERLLFSRLRSSSRIGSRARAQRSVAA